MNLFVLDVQPEYFENFDLTNIVTPVNADILEKALVETNYDPVETKFLVQRFKEGFDLEYKGLMERWDTARNLHSMWVTKQFYGISL